MSLRPRRRALTHRCSSRPRRSRPRAGGHDAHCGVFAGVIPDAHSAPRPAPTTLPAVKVPAGPAHRARRQSARARGCGRKRSPRASPRARPVARRHRHVRADDRRERARGSRARRLGASPSADPRRTFRSAYAFAHARARAARPRAARRRPDFRVRRARASAARAASRARRDARSVVSPAARPSGPRATGARDRA